MLVPQKLIIQGFASFDAPQVLDFTKIEEGLIFISGENKVEPSLGSNGAGKSSILNALTWSLYGKTTCGLKAGNVKNRKTTKKCQVDFLFTNNNIPFTLSRTHAPNSLSLNGKTITQEALDVEIGLDYTSFLYSILVSQFSTKFLDLLPSEKLSIFSSIMEDSLAIWEQYSDKAKLKAQLEESLIRGLEKDIAKLEGSLERLIQTDYTTQKENYEHSRISRIKKLKSELQDFQDGILAVEEEIKSISLDDSLKEELVNLQKLTDETLNVIQNLEKRKRLLEQELKKIQWEIDSCHKRIAKIENLDSICPTCYQVIDKEHQQKLIAEENTQIDTLSQLLKPLQCDLSVTQDNYNNYTLDQRTLIDEIKELEDKIKEESTKIRILEKEKEGYVNESVRIKDQIDKEKLLVNPFDQYQKQLEEDLSSTQDQLKKKQKSLKEHEREYEIYKYWQKGFKDIRLYIIEMALQEFEIQINNHLQQLGLCDWEIILEIDQETKSGTVKRGFHVFVKSPNNTEPVPFESWSGGESQRLRLAGTLGLMDFISDRRGIKWDVEFYDEPSQHLSPEGIENTIELLAYRAKNQNKKIFFIDHKDLNSCGDFSNIITVIKEKDGSKIYQ